MVLVGITRWRRAFNERFAVFFIIGLIVDLIAGMKIFGAAAA